MKTAATILLMLIRLSGLVLVTLGILFWTGNAGDLIPVHMLLGLVLVLSLWALAFIAARAGAPAGQVAVAVAWGLVVPILGVTQDQILGGDAHWLIRILHLLVGLIAIGMAEGLGARVRRAPAPAV
jgi:hypothetical protein